MRKIGMAVAMSLFIAWPAFTQAINSTVESDDAIVLTEGETLSTVWHEREEYREMFRGSGGFLALWRETCKLNTEIPCTDSAYRHLPVGTRLKLPLLPKPEPEVIVTQAPKVESAAVRETPSFAMPSIWMFGGATILVWILQYVGRRKAQKEILKRDREIAQLKKLTGNMNAFINERFYMLETPKGMKQLDGKSLTPFLRTKDIEGKPAVLTARGIPVMIKNLVGHLDNLPPNYLVIERFEKEPLAQVA